MNIICIDLGGTRIKSGLFVDDLLIDHKIVKTEYHKGMDEVVKKIHVLIDNISYSNNLNKNDLNGLAISFPGLVDRREKVAIYSKGKFHDVMRYNVQSHFDIPLVIDNDARLYTYGEWQHGAGKDTHDFVAITIGTGIGVGAVVDDNLLVGNNYCSGILGGHISIDYNGPVCGCGNIGCGEALASATALENMLIDYYRRGRYKVLNQNNNLNNAKNIKIFFQQYLEYNDPVINEIYNIYIKRIGTVISNIIHAYGPEVVAIGGGVSNTGDFLIEDINKYIKEILWLPYDIKIIRAKLGDLAALYGGYELFKEFETKYN